ncbi:ATP-binding protein [Cupriavidus metallidurans]|uniref:ATP-binding protein n=1 Tax=Cupriavidus metallidurans TaxID=119219 RepID=UPI000054F1FE|nr:ATP-binding protein [Cupriavidus metallidurans]QGS32442.1 AAA family ATPase [Cupriavidus metallidurans]
MKTKPNEYILPSHTFEGERDFIEAEYLPSLIPEFAGNPLVEALPQDYYGQETIKGFASYPSFSDEQRFMPRSFRLHAVSRLRTFLETLPWHISVMQDIFKNVWNGYASRNPLVNRRQTLQERYRLAMQTGTVLPLQAHMPSHAATFGLLGPSGIGKSTVVDRSLQCLPQVLKHSKHGIVQLVWLKVECPPDGSLKQLMYWILEQVDEQLGSKYAKYITKQMGLDDRMALVGRTLERHFTGLLVLDEIHNVLRDARWTGQPFVDIFEP